MPRGQTWSPGPNWTGLRGRVPLRRKRGPEEWRKWLTGGLQGLTKVRFDVAQVIDLPSDTVVSVGHMRGRGRASGVAALGAGVWTLRDGQVTGVIMYPTRDQSLKAAGLQE